MVMSTCDWMGASAQQVAVSIGKHGEVEVRFLHVEAVADATTCLIAQRVALVELRGGNLEDEAQAMHALLIRTPKHRDAPDKPCSVHSQGKSPGMPEHAARSESRHV